MYVYTVRMAPTSLTTAKVLIQIKPITATIHIISAVINQVTKINASEMLAAKMSRWTGAFTAGTVTSFTPLKKGNTQDPASLAVGGTAATGVNATVEPTGGTEEILEETVWNILNAEWPYVPIPEARITVANGELFTLKLNTAPAAAMVIGATVNYVEFR